MTTVYSHLVFPKSWHVIISFFIHGHAYMTHISEMPGPLFKKILPTGVTGTEELEECFHLIAHVLRAQHPDEELRVREVAEGVHVADRETPRLTCVLAILLHFNIVSMFFSSKFFFFKAVYEGCLKGPLPHLSSYHPPLFTSQSIGRPMFSLRCSIKHQFWKTEGVGYITVGMLVPFEVYAAHAMFHEETCKRPF